MNMKRIQESGVRSQNASAGGYPVLCGAFTRPTRLSSRSRSVHAAYTLFEILLVLALIAIIGAATIPLWHSSTKSQGEKIESDIRDLVRKNRTTALRRNERRLIVINEGGLESPDGSVSLPDNWRLEVQRIGTNRFRPPIRIPMPETWEITADGLLEPLLLRVYSTTDDYQLVLAFCSLTALPLPPPQ